MNLKGGCGLMQLCDLIIVSDRLSHEDNFSRTTLLPAEERRRPLTEQTEMLTQGCRVLAGLH